MTIFATSFFFFSVILPILQNFSRFDIQPALSQHSRSQNPMATNADPLRELMSLIKDCNELFGKALNDEYIQKMRDLFK